MAATTHEMAAPSTALGPGKGALAVPALLHAVRRRLWMRQFTAAIRAATWTTAALMLAASAVHGAWRPVAPVAMMVALGVVWSAWLAWAAWQRPDDRACALWADQQLGGESAFTTWLDTCGASQGRAQLPAERLLAAWAAARVPVGLRELAAQHETPQLMRPLLAMAVCGSLAGLVLTLPGMNPAPPPSAANVPQAAAPDAALRLADVSTPAVLAGEIAAALRTAPSLDAAPPAGGPRTAAAGAAQNDNPGAPDVARAGPAPAGARPAPLPMPAAAADTGAAAGAASPQAAGAAGAAGGREAGDGADTRAAPGASRALRGTMEVRGVALAAAQAQGQPRANTDEAASYQRDGGEHGRGTAREQPLSAAAATPPPASESMRLTPTQASYVQAWMKARPQRP